MKKKFFLVTGGTGFIGSSLVRKLVLQGHRVRVLDNDWRGKIHNLSDMRNKIEFIKGDIRKLSDVGRAIKGVDAVCHLAFVNGTENFYKIPEIVLEVGVKGMINVIDACLKHQVKELVLASSSEVYQTPSEIPTPETVPLIVPNPFNPRYSYGGGKIISELLAINYGRKYFKRMLIFRPHNVYGPNMGWEHVIPQFVKRMKPLLVNKKKIIQFPIQGTGRETRSFIYIDDFTDALYHVISKGKHMNIYHIGTQEEVSILTVAKKVAAYFHRPIQIKAGQEAMGGTPRRCPDVSKLKNLGFKPKFSLDEGLQKTVEWYSKELKIYE